MFLWFMHAIAGIRNLFLLLLPSGIPLNKYATICLSILILMVNGCLQFGEIISKNLLWTFLYRTFWKKMFFFLLGSWLPLKQTAELLPTNNVWGFQWLFFLTNTWYGKLSLFLPFHWVWNGILCFYLHFSDVPFHVLLAICTLCWFMTWHEVYFGDNPITDWEESTFYNAWVWYSL